MRKNFRLLIGTLAVLFTVGSCDMYPHADFRDIKRGHEVVKHYNNAMVLKWNEVLSTAVDGKMPPPPESRIYAMVTLAIHDALNNVVPKFDTYALDYSGLASKEVSKKTIRSIADAAVAQAAFDVLVAIYAPSATVATEALESSLSGIPDSEYKDLGLQIGAEAAAAILAKRQDDVLPAFQQYSQGDGPGEYRSTIPFSLPNPQNVWTPPAAYSPFWGTTEPFGVLSGNQFRPKPPYPLNSPEYTSDYNEVKLLGQNVSTARTDDQLHTVLFFTENMPSMLNKVAKTLAVSGKLNGFDTARLLALMQMIVADGLICGFDANYHYNYWRPITAIQLGETDGNPETEGDPAWGPVTAARPTPPNPSYPSSYSIATRGGAELLKIYFGTDKKSFTIESITAPGERSYTSFSQLANEVGLSRIYGGHNFRNDHVAGDKMGLQIARFVYKNNLRELH